MTKDARWAVLLRDKLTLATTALCLAALVASGWIVFEAGAGVKEPRSRRFTHMHCPACGEEMPYLAAKAAGRCESCVAAPPYVPTAGSVKEGGGGSAWVRGVAFFAAVVIVLEGLAYFFVLRGRASSRAEERKRNRRLNLLLPLL